jgi:signal transduction histidine kinase
MRDRRCCRYVGGVQNAVRRAWAWLESHPLTSDAALALCLLGIALVTSHAEVDLFRFSDPNFPTPSRLEEIAGLTLAIAPLAVRRRAPLASLVACTAGFIVSRQFLDLVEAAVVPIALSLAVYSAAAHGRPRVRHLVCALCLVAIMGDLWYELQTTIPAELPDRRTHQVIQLMVNFALFSAMWALGTALGTGRTRAEELVNQTVALEHERETNARRAVFDERVRIARELHDVVAHHVSLMGVQAGAARLVMAREPSKATAALASIEVSSRQTVVELHRLLGFLRQAGDPEEMALRPGVAQLPGLVAGLHESGLEVAVSVDGQARPLPATVDVSAYRIVQEALTNTLKHADATSADVRLHYRPGALELEVVDDGHGSAPSAAPSPSSGGGLGLIGMRERAALHGGRLTAGPRPGGGYAVRAMLLTPDGAA